MTNRATRLLAGSGSPTSPIADTLALQLVGAPGGRFPSAPERPLPAEDFEQLLSLLERHRLLGALVEAVDAGTLPVDDTQHHALAERHRVWAVHALRLERLLGRASAVLAPRRIEARLLKGAALAHLVYADPAYRVFVDIDLLVRAEELAHAVTAMERELGAEVPVAELRPGFDREFGKDATVRVGGVELDLHRTLVSGPFGLLLDLEELWSASIVVEIGGRRYATLGANQLFLHACYEVALGDHPLRLGALRDLLRIRTELPIDLGEVVVAARRSRATVVVQRAALLALEVLDGQERRGLDQLAALSVPRRERLLLRAYLTRARSYTRPLASLAVVPGVRGRARYARAIVVPSGEYLRSRGWTMRAHVRRAADHLRGRG